MQLAAESLGKTSLVKERVFVILFKTFLATQGFGTINWIWISVTVTSYGEILLQLL